MSPTTAFPVSFLVTLVLLCAVVYTGVKARRRAHIPLVVITVLSLGLTIYYAEQLGKLYDLFATGRIYQVHLTLAKTTVVIYLAPVITGVLTLRNSKRRGLHSVFAWLVLVFTVLTAVTGCWMIYLADPL